MKQEPCLMGCKYNNDGMCLLYHIKLEMISVPDPYDKGMLVTHGKCVDCMEKELSCSIDDKVRDIYSFYHSFREEMDILFTELDILVEKRKDIYRD